MSRKNPQENMSASDYNLITLETDRLEKHVAATIQMGGNITIVGRRGSGKTEIAKQQIKKADMVEVYLNLSMLERVDMGGYPNIMGAKDASFVSFILPEFYRAMMDTSPNAKKVVALLDEVDKAALDLNAPLLEFTQFKSVNGRKLPNLQSVIMTGNLIAEGGQRPSLPLLDRSEKYLIQPSAEKWLLWAGRSNQIHPSVTAFINDNQQHLFGEVNADENYADPSPRGWHNASKWLFAGEELGLSDDILIDKVAGCVGKQSGLHYKMYFHHYRKLLPLVEKLYTATNKKDMSGVLKEYSKLNPSEKFVLLMIACSRFATKLDIMKSNKDTAFDLFKTGKLPDYVKNVGDFLNDDSVAVESTLVSIRTQVSSDRFSQHNLDEIPVFNSLLERINNLLNNSGE